MGAQFHATQILVAKFFQYSAGAGGSSETHGSGPASLNKTKQWLKLSPPGLRASGFCWAC